MASNASQGSVANSLKVKAFVENLLKDLFGCFCETLNVQIQYSTEHEKRTVPHSFYYDIIVFSQVFVRMLRIDEKDWPIRLFCNEDFFKSFTNSVCLKLISNEDPEVGFLKVMAFLVVMTSMSFVNACYRPIDNIPPLLERLLEDHIKTNFYEEDRFSDVTAHIVRLRADQPWLESAVQEMRTYINESLQTELAATKPCYFDEIQTKRGIATIADVRALPESVREDKNCAYCTSVCTFFLKEFFRPKIVYKNPECYQM